jgi:CubicO group peptidase (beta-lactamase class C family)
MKKIGLFILLCTSLVFAAAGSEGGASAKPDGRYGEVEHLMKSARLAMKIPGIAVTVVEHDQIVWSGADGLADLEQQVPATPKTVWRVASASKPIAAAATMQLVEQGKVKLDEPIWTYLPWYPQGRCRHHRPAHPHPYLGHPALRLRGRREGERRLFSDGRSGLACERGRPRAAAVHARHGLPLFQLRLFAARGHR